MVVIRLDGRRSGLNVYCGIDWAERHHDVALVVEAGTVIAQRRISETTSGYQELLEMCAAAGDGPQQMIRVAIETPHGVSRKKSDRQDAIMLANILRTDMAMHRALPADTEQAEAVSETQPG